MTHMIRRKRSRVAPALEAVMILFAVLFLLAGVLLDRGFMLSCFLMAALYYLYRMLSIREFEYQLEGTTLSVDQILGNRMRRTVLVADLKELLVCAPHDSSRVDAWRKSSGSRVKKYDFTSGDPEIPYDTMIVRIDGEETKLLVELSEEMHTYLAQRCPGKVERVYEKDRNTLR